MLNMGVKSILLASFLFFLLTLTVNVDGSGKIRVKLSRFLNPSGRDKNGNCCDGLNLEDRCPTGKCDNRYTLCATSKNNSLDDSDCEYGKQVFSGVDENNSNNFTDEDIATFVFNTWPGSITLVVRVTDSDVDGEMDIDLYTMTFALQAGASEPDSVFTSRNLVGTRQKNPTRLSLSMSVFCDKFYYGADCAKRCVESNSCDGHYTCDVQGDIVCNKGWTGSRCQQEIIGSEVDCSIYRDTDLNQTTWSGAVTCNGIQHPVDLAFTGSSRGTIAIEGQTLPFMSQFNRTTYTLTIQPEHNTTLARVRDLLAIRLNANVFSGSVVLDGETCDVTCVKSVGPCGLDGTCVRYGKSAEDYYCCCQDGKMADFCEPATTTTRKATTSIQGATTQALASVTTDTPAKPNALTSKKELSLTTELPMTVEPSTVSESTSTISTTPAIQTGPTAPSTGTQERNDLDCSGGRMRIHVPQTLLPTHIVTLRDPSCKVASNGSHLLADVGVNECGTTVSFTNDSVIFTNELVATALSGTTAPTIIDYGMNMKDQRVKISCIYPRENRIDFSYVPVMKEAHFYERQYGKLSFDVSQYSDEQFSHAIPHNGLPIGVTLNTELFIDISLRHASHKGVGIMVDSCIATPTSSPADPLWYTVIKDGCPAQQDVRTFASPDVDEFRFSFLVFRFTQAPLQKAGPNLPPTSMVFIHCQVSACPSQNCTNTCNPAGSHRVRREAELENSHLVSAGPFYLKSEEERGGYNGGVVAASVSMAVVATLVAIVALVAWRRSVNKLSKHQTLDEAS